MDTTRIAELLQPFLTVPDPAPKPCHSERSEESAVLTPDQLNYISIYIDLLLRWNARINLTAIRHPEEIVTRHFGESLLAARHLFPAPVFPAKTTWGQPSPAVQAERSSATAHVIDVGAGAGFPGLPIKIWAPDINLTLIESNHKKATFLREVTRTLTLMNINVFPGRAQDYPNPPAEVVTLRAVERFDATLLIAARLVAPGGRLALLISEAQLARTHNLTPEFAWPHPVNIPLSSTRRLVIGVRNPEQHASG
ncbi:MAG TPA: 16S rRNA (guanine(527)-N(7))-methyltransferase RsmG [Terriglobales bacterium]|nr:16S rRNA (guanine(527)-N(7))-methyltransferase RsmG [Terriglobales bacterium]